jgi:hypothetical protein
MINHHKTQQLLTKQRVDLVLKDVCKPHFGFPKSPLSAPPMFSTFSAMSNCPRTL